MKASITTTLILLCSCSVELPWPVGSSSAGDADTGDENSDTGEVSSGPGATSVVPSDTGTLDASTSGEDSSSTGECAPTELYVSHYPCDSACADACADDGLPFCREGEAGPLSTCAKICEEPSDCNVDINCDDDPGCIPPYFPDFGPDCAPALGRCVIPCNDRGLCPATYECILEVGETDGVWHCMPHAL